jgi:hypothetical protein
MMAIEVLSNQATGSVQEPAVSAALQVGLDTIWTFPSVGEICKARKMLVALGDPENMDWLDHCPPLRVSSGAGPRRAYRYDDYLDGRISEDFWTRKSEQWEQERRGLEAQILRLAGPRQPDGAHGPEDFRTRETGRFSLPTAESSRTASIARNRAFELHLRSRNSLSHIQ